MRSRAHTYDLPWVPSGVTRVEPSTAKSAVLCRYASLTMLVTEQASESAAVRTETLEIPSPLPPLLTPPVAVVAAAVAAGVD